MIKYQINDNELLYLIYEKNDYAFELLCEKYTPMIKRRIKDFRINPRYYDDYYQEALIMLDKAVKTYKDSMDKSFNKYFDLILQRRIIYLLKKENNYYLKVSLCEDVEALKLEETKEEKVEIELDYSLLSDFEKEVFDKKYYQNIKIENIAKEYNTDARSIYNALSRAKCKLRKNNNCIK